MGYKNMNFKNVVIAFSLPMFSFAAAAGEGDKYEWEMEFGNPYIGISFNQNRLDTPYDVDLDSIMLRAGMQFNDYFTAELRLAGGLNDEDTFFGSSSLDSHYGFYAKAAAPFQLGFSKDAPTVAPYLVIGISEARFDYNDVSLKQSGFSYGLGFDFSVVEDWIFSAEYLRLIDTNDIFIETISFGLTYKF